MDDKTQNTGVSVKPAKTKEQLARAARNAKRYRDKQKQIKEAAAQGKAEGVTEFKAQQKANQKEYPAKTKATEAAAKAIIADAWGITREHIIDRVFYWGKRAAEQLKISPSDSFWAEGPLATVEDRAAVKIQGDENIVVGEITYKRELLALYVFMEEWRKLVIPDAILTFEGYLAERRSFKYDGTINRGNKYFGMNFHDKPHAKWDDMFLKWNADSLRPDYSRQDVINWLGSLSEFKKRLLIACRSSFKSTFSLVFLIAAILCCADIRLLFVTETNELVNEFMKSFVHFFKVKNPNEPNRFNRLFPEFCVGADETVKDLFQCPMSILGLPQPTVKTTSMESGGWAGNRADYILISDVVSNKTVGNEKQIQKTVDSLGAISELIEVGGYYHVEGTPWHENDALAQMLETNARSGGKDLLYIINPAWEVLPSGEGKAVQDLEENDVELMFPARLTWDVLQAKLRGDKPPYRQFRMQSLCMFLPEVEDDQKLHFRRDDITRNHVDYALVPRNEGRIVASSDLAFSKSRYADLTCFTIMKITDEKLFVLEQKSGHLNDTEKAIMIVDMYRRYPQLDTWAIEKPANHENLERAIREEGRKYGVVVPVRWDTVKTTLDSKFHRLKSIESVIGLNIVKFVTNTPGATPGWLEDLTTELLTLDDTTAKRRSHDDRGDSLALGIQRFAPAAPNTEEAKRREEEELKQSEKARAQAEYDMHFGPSHMYGIVPKALEELIEDTDLLDRYIHPAIRKNATLSFAYMKNRKTNS